MSRYICQPLHIKANNSLKKKMFLYMTDIERDSSMLKMIPTAPAKTPKSSLSAV